MSANGAIMDAPRAPRRGRAARAVSALEALPLPDGQAALFAARANHLRTRGDHEHNRVTVELFYDLVFVFAVTAARVSTRGMCRNHAAGTDRANAGAFVWMRVRTGHR
jgi:hypothetical protein